MTDSGSMRLNGGELLTRGDRVAHDSAAGTFYSDVLSDGTTFGNSEPLVRAINTLMTQGSWESLGPFGNRQPAIVIEITGETPDALNAGEMWLSALMKPGALEWLPPGHTVWTVFDVVWCYISRSEDDRWDLDENTWTRRYVIPIKALPYARSPELTTTDADPSAATAIIDTQVTAASTTTGFTGAWYRESAIAGSTNSGTITPAVVAGRVRATYTQAGPPLSVPKATIVQLGYTFTTPVPAATPYVRVDVEFFAGQPHDNGVAYWSNGVSNGYVTPVRQNITDLGGSKFGGSAYYRVPVGTTQLVIYGLMRPQTSVYVEIDQVRVISRLPDLGTNRQKFAGLTPGGSAPAEGNLHVEHTTAGLGKTIVHTYPMGRPSPALMQFQSTTGITPIADTSAVNGQRIPIQTNVSLTVPNPQLPTRGRAALWAKMQVDTAQATVEWTVSAWSGGVPVGAAGQQRQVTVGVGTNLLVPLGLITLPSAENGPSGVHTFSFGRISGTGIMSIDEVWAFGVDDDSALTIVDAGSGTPATGGASNHLWINAPTPTRPAGEVLIGTKLDDARWPSLTQAGPAVHKFPPGGVSILAVTCSATDASTSLTHYKRWTHHASESS